MCSSESCLGYLLLMVILGFSVLIFFLIKYRKYLQDKDLQISAEQIWKMRPDIILNRNISKADMIFGVWQDKTASVTELVVKNSNDEVVGVVEHHMGSREYRILMGEQIFRVELPVNWGRSIAHLVSNDGKIQATYERKSFSMREHKYSILNFGELKSKRSLLSLRQSIEYFQNEKFMAMTCQISSFRKIGRVGFFSLDYPLQIRIFILAICF